jgi:hypothetical protein
MNWVKTWLWAREKPDAPRDLLALAQRHALKKARPPRPQPPKHADKDSIKDKLRRQCEALCKAIVKKRDLGPDGWGKCITCTVYSNRLQWGHFIAQGRSDYLRYWPPNSAMQCGGCNGPGQGMSREFAKAIDARDGAGAAAALEFEQSRHATWQATILSLEEKRDELQRLLDLQSGKFEEKENIK